MRACVCAGVITGNIIKMDGIQRRFDMPLRLFINVPMQMAGVVGFIAVFVRGINIMKQPNCPALYLSELHMNIVGTQITSFLNRKKCVWICFCTDVHDGKPFQYVRQMVMTLIRKSTPN